MKPEVIIVRVQREESGQYGMDIRIDSEPVTGAQSDRVLRTYTTASDALTSARHAVKEVTKERPAAMR